MNKDQLRATGTASRMSVAMGQGEDRFHVTVSAGVERFIGRYPRVEGLCRPGEVLKFTPAP